MATDLVTTQGIHPVTGDTVALTTYTPEQLAGEIDAMKHLAAAVKDYRAAMEAELIARLEQAGRKQDRVGPFDVTVRSGRTRKWDVDELEGVLQMLADSEVIQASEAAGLIVTERKVAGGAANALAGRLSGSARDALDGCFEWKQGKPSVEVKPA